VLQEFQFEIITTEHVKKTILNLTPKTSCGVDGLSYKLLKFIFNEISHPFSIIINQCFSTATFPDNLKLAKIIPAL
jgi:hypothetical protein